MFGVEVNVKYLGTRSNKLRQVPYIENYICDKLDCQEVRRLCRYLTLDPLADVALDYGGNVVQQPDLQDSLMNRVVRDVVSGGCEEYVLSNYMFSEQIVSEARIMIFVYCSNIVFSERASRYGTSTMGYQTYNIDIVYPIEIDKICGGLKRSWAIATILMDKLDDLMVDDPKYVDSVGNVKFEFKENQATNVKLAPNTSMAILRVPFAVTVSGIRGKK